MTGRQLYVDYCQQCHQPDGAGIAGRFPPLRSSSWVAGAPEIPVRILLDGLHGPLRVGGQWYDGEMPGFRNQLSDQQIAELVSYLRSRNFAGEGAIGASLVRDIRAASASRRSSWTARELRGYHATLWVCAAAALIGGLAIIAFIAAHRRDRRVRP